jgi:ethanolamine utilization protein EutN
MIILIKCGPKGSCKNIYPDKAEQFTKKVKSRRVISMLLAKVIGNVWATKKLDSISAIRLLFVQPLGKDLRPVGSVQVAADEVGAGFGEMVIVTQGAPAMQAFSKADLIPIDAVVVGIADNLEMFEDVSRKKK